MTWIADFSGNGEDALGERCVIANSLSAASVQGTDIFQYNSQEKYCTKIVFYHWCNFYLVSSYSYTARFSVDKLDHIECPFHSVFWESLCHIKYTLWGVPQRGSPFLSDNLSSLLSVQMALFLSTTYIRSGLFLEAHKQWWAISSLVI